jgi:hypothetical protein
MANNAKKLRFSKMENTILSLQNKLKIYKAIICVLSGFLLAMVLCIIFTKKTSQNEDMGHLKPIKVDSIVRTDTVYIEIPKTLIKYKEITKVESVYVEVPTTQEKIPFEQKHYQDSIADIYISGFQPSLDSINYRIPKQTIYVDRTIEVPQTEPWYKNRFIISAGFSAQYGLVHKQWDVGPYIGLGIRLY